MDDDLLEFGLGETVRLGPGQVAAELLGVPAADETSDGDQAAVAWGEFGPRPDVTEQDVVRERDELRGEVADELLCGGWHGLSS